MNILYEYNIISYNSKSNKYKKIQQLIKIHKREVHFKSYMIRI